MDKRLLDELSARAGLMPAANELRQGQAKVEQTSNTDSRSSTC